MVDVVRAAGAGATGTSLTVTPAAAALPGSLLLAFVNVSQYSSARTVTPPTGWVLFDDRTSTSGPNDRLQAFWKIAGASEPASYVFSISGSAENHSMTYLELSGANKQPPSIKAVTLTTGNTTPSVTNMAAQGMAIGVWLSDSGTTDGAGAQTVTAGALGWVKQNQSQAAYHSTMIATARIGPVQTASATGTATTGGWTLTATYIVFDNLLGSGGYG